MFSVEVWPVQPTLASDCVCRVSVPLPRPPPPPFRGPRGAPAAGPGPAAVAVTRVEIDIERHCASAEPRRACGASGVLISAGEYVKLIKRCKQNVSLTDTPITRDTAHLS